MKEKILSTLEELGFKPEPAEDLGYFFSFEGLNYLFFNNNDDEDFLSIALPGVIEKDDVGQEVLTLLTERINSTIKYVKAYCPNDSIWIFYERELLGNENLDELLPRMIVCLENAYIFTRSTMNELTGGGNNGDDGDENND